MGNYLSTTYYADHIEPIALHYENVGPNEQIFKFPIPNKRPSKIFIQPDLYKIIMVGKQESGNQHYYAIYDIKSRKLIQKAIYFGNQLSNWYSSAKWYYYHGFFEECDGQTFFVLFIDPPEPEQIFIINMHSGKYTTKLMKDKKEMKDLKMQRNRYSPRLQSVIYNENGFTIYKWRPTKHRERVEVYRNDTMIKSIPNVPNKQDRAYFIANKMKDSEYIRLISGFVRSILKEVLFPKDLLQCICEYGNKESTYFVTYSDDTFRIDKVQ